MRIILRGCLLLGCLNLASIGWTQRTVQLKIQPVRLAHAQETERNARKTNDPQQLAEAWYLYGKAYALAGDRRASQGYFLRSLQLLEPRGISWQLSRLYVRLSENERQMGHAQEAMQYARRALTVAQRSGIPKALALSYGMMAELYDDRWDGKRNTDADSVLTYLRQGNELYRRSNDTLGMAESNAYLGSYFTRVRDRRGIAYLQQALHQFDLLHIDSLKSGVLLGLAESYLRFGQPALAHQALLEAERLYTVRRVDEISTRMGLEQQFANYYRAVKQWHLAFVHQENYARLERRQLMADHDGTVARMGILYETHKKEVLLNAQRNELALRNANLKAQQWSTVVIFLLFLLAVGVSVLLFRLYQRNKRTSQYNAELVREQNHRVKNNLQVISSLLTMQARRLTNEVARKAVEESRLRIESMAFVHRRLYDGDRLGVVRLNEFIQDLTNGVLQTFNCEHVRLEMDVDDSYLLADKATALGLILNELITNACKYAFPGQQHPLLHIHCHQHQHTVTLLLMDNGPGLDESLMAAIGTDGPGTLPPKSFGMILIRSLTTQLKGTCRFSTAWTMADQFGSVPDNGLPAAPGTLFTLTFPASDD